MLSQLLSILQLHPGKCWEDVSDGCSMTLQAWSCPLGLFGSSLSDDRLKENKCIWSDGVWHSQSLPFSSFKCLMFRMSALLMDTCSYAYMGVYALIVSLVQRSVQFLQALFFTPSTDFRRKGQSWTFVLFIFFSACLPWVVIEFCDHKLAKDLPWIKDRTTKLVKVKHYSKRKPTMILLPPFHLNAAGFLKY